MENKLEKIGQNSFMDNFVKTDDILKDMCGIIESSQKAAYRAVNTTLIQRNWLLGYRIASEELQGEDRAKYGAEIIKKLAKELSAEYGKGYTKSNLYSFYSFYKTYPEIFQTSSGKSVGLLSWSHYATLLQVKEKAARDWYEKEAAKQTWSVRTLQRNISSQYYYRMLKTQKKELVESEMKELTAPYQNDKLEFIKNPVVAEFLGFSQNTDFTARDNRKEQVICFCGKAAAYPYGETGLLYRPCVLQLHTEMLCPHRPENRKDNTSRCRTDGYVYPYV